MKVGLLGLVVSGCWSEPGLVDDAFTPAQWTRLQAELTVPALDACALSTGTWAQPRCDRLARLGQQLFFEPAFSRNGATACVTCHDPGRWFVDAREDNQVSRSVTEQSTLGWTRRNAISVVNVGLTATLAPKQQVFTWVGKYASSGEVLALALTAMGQPKVPASYASVAGVIRNSPSYAAQYADVFARSSGLASDEQVFQDVELAFEAYMRRLGSVDAPFDRYLAGDASAIDDRARRGFAVFVGRGTCIECHRGPAFTDLQFHSTGVPQVGHAPAVDPGRVEITDAPDDTGRFRTSSLRNIAETGPYMHDGALASLDDVIWFYRRGGGVAGYEGDKDPRLTPLELTDDDARDLEAFLRTLTGAEIDPSLRVDLRMPMACAGATCAP
ncbi:MAG: hypothetical protein NT062_09700 [Proteobacteria bacterium]|nr:hypothetical protein [Pseudomonadota bacterium]